MGYYKLDDNATDYEKLQKAISEVTNIIGSVDNVLEAIGLAGMPMAQRYGIVFGCIVFVGTVCAVIALLILGGTFRRIVQQLETGSESSLLTESEQRRQRVTLLEQSTEAQQRLVGNYTDTCLATTKTTTELTPLAAMILNVRPPPAAAAVVETPPTTYSAKTITPMTNAMTMTTTTIATINPITCVNPQQHDETINDNNDTKNYDNDDDDITASVYQKDYIEAYCVCRDKPGGKVLPGRPDARMVAYARGYAGCGRFCSRTYRRSYGRMYERLACAVHNSNDKYDVLYKEHPEDIIGQYVRLENLQVDRHLNELHTVLSGMGEKTGTKSYDPNDVWGFLPDGPFEYEADMIDSFVFQRKYNEAGFAIVHTITDRILGFVLIVNDDPHNLSIEIEPPIVIPSENDTQYPFEACYILMDRLFAYGYRRIYMSVDTHDTVKRKLCTRLGCTLEGVLYKHMIVKDASRDSVVYSILNSDWFQGGARSALFKKLYGPKMYVADVNNELYEQEQDEKQRQLLEHKKHQQKQGKEQEHGTSEAGKKNV